MRAWLWGGLFGLFLWEVVNHARLSRRFIREFFTLVVKVDLAAVGMVRRIFPPRYELLGACQRRGACCTQIVADPPSWLKGKTLLARLYVGMHKLIHNFEVVGTGPTGQWIFRCNFLQPDHRCGIWRLRPRLCRNYPLLPFFKAPQLLPGCGYRVKRRGMGTHRKLPIVDAHVGTHHPTPPTRSGDTALEHPEDFTLKDIVVARTDLKAQQK